MPISNESYTNILLSYFSKYIIPVLMISIVSGVLYGYAAIQNNKNEVCHTNNEVRRVASEMIQVKKEHNCRIIANRIDNKCMSDRVSKIEGLVPLILQAVESIDKKMSKTYARLGKIEGDMGILKDRANRGIIKDL